LTPSVLISGTQCPSSTVGLNGLTGVVRVRRYVIKALFASVIVFLAASHFPSVCNGAENGEEPDYIPFLKSIREANEPVEAESLVRGRVLVSDNISTDRLREVKALAPRMVRRTDSANGHQFPTVFHRIEGVWDSPDAINDQWPSVHLLNESWRLAVVGKLVAEPVFPSYPVEWTVAVSHNSDMSNSEAKIWSFGQDNAGGLHQRSISGLPCSLTGVLQLKKLPNEQAGLNDRHEYQANREPRKPVRIVGDPLRFESEFFVDYRFLFSCVLGLIGLFFGVWSGHHLHRERYLVGAALIGCGWLCGLFGWLIAGSWRL
jgi:hypothetical protein